MFIILYRDKLHLLYKMLVGMQTQTQLLILKFKLD